MNFPDFNTWHEVPKDATIPAGTPMLEKYGSGNCYYTVEGYPLPVCPREMGTVVRTEKRILDPDESATWARAERMYRIVHPSMDFAWEYQSQDTKDRWYTVATEKYDEKED